MRTVLVLLPPSARSVICQTKVCPGLNSRVSICIRQPSGSPGMFDGAW
ncbi:hypothetical protein AB0L05_34825 [Nonomuraea pusilla]